MKTPGLVLQIYKTPTPPNPPHLAKQENNPTHLVPTSYLDCGRVIYLDAKSSHVSSVPVAACVYITSRFTWSQRPPGGGRHECTSLFPHSESDGSEWRHLTFGLPVEVHCSTVMDILPAGSTV